MNVYRFLSDQKGNITIIFALSAVVLLGAAGVAVDIMRQTNIKTHLDAAADAAALGATAYISENSNLDAKKLDQAATNVAQKLWDANVTDELDNVRLTPVIDIDPNKSVKVSYTGRMPTSFSTLLGLSKLNVSGSSTAAIGSNVKYWDFTFAIDTSASMGIGATQAVMDSMKSDRALGCTFACHYSDTNRDTLAVARQKGYKLRVDVVGDAVVNTINTISANSAISARAALYGMNNSLELLESMTPKLNQIENHRIQLSLTTGSIGNTSYMTSMKKLTTEVGVSGQGLTQESPRKVTSIVTDGIGDTLTRESNTYIPLGSFHELGPISPDFCSKLKANGSIVGVLYINYITPGGYEIYINPFIDKVLPALKGCATEGYFYNANTPTEIQNAMNQILTKAFQSDVRLSQ